MKIKKDMIVKVVSGNFKGMTGKVLKVIPISQRAIVEGVALTKRAVRPTQENPQGGFSERERSRGASGCWFSCARVRRRLLLFRG